MNKFDLKFINQMEYKTFKNICYDSICLQNCILLFGHDIL